MNKSKELFETLSILESFQDKPLAGRKFNTKDGQKIEVLSTDEHDAIYSLLQGDNKDRQPKKHPLVDFDDWIADEFVESLKEAQDRYPLAKRALSAEDIAKLDDLFKKRDAAGMQNGSPEYNKLQAEIDKLLGEANEEKTPEDQIPDIFPKEAKDGYAAYCKEQEAKDVGCASFEDWVRDTEWKKENEDDEEGGNQTGQEQGEYPQESKARSAHRMLSVMESELDAAQRNALPNSDFAIPVTRSYPIHDIEHARNALARASGKPEEATVKAKVYARYPSLKDGK